MFYFYCRYKSDLSSSLERERILENAKTQLELDWRRRLELKENELHNQNEILQQNMRNSQEEVHVVHLPILFICFFICCIYFIVLATLLRQSHQKCHGHSGILSANTHHK